jgi:hypothetical protein
MIKNFYIVAWLLLIGSAVHSILNGTLNELAMVSFGLIGLALVYALALWAVLINPGHPQPHQDTGKAVSRR